MEAGCLGSHAARWYGSLPYGKDVVGYLIYTADGYMSAEIMDLDRQQSDPDFPLEIAAAQTLPDPDRARPTAPTYPIAEPTQWREIRNPSRESGIDPSWTGSEQPRHFRLSTAA